MTRERTMVVVVMDGLQLLDLAGPVEVLRIANRLGGNPSYRPVVATPGGGDVRSDSGVRVGGDVALDELARSRRPTVIRGLLVPAFMRLAGEANWWAPPPLRRLHARWGFHEAPPPPDSP